MDRGYVMYVGAHTDPPNVHDITSETASDDGATITRVSRITPKVNPVPIALQGMLNCRGGFTFTMTERWHRDKFDVGHALTFATEPPVMADRIVVYSGTPGIECTAHSPVTLADGFNRFLADLRVTFRRDPINLRPRINKKGSLKDSEQKAAGVYYLFDAPEDDED